MGSLMALRSGMRMSAPHFLGNYCPPTMGSDQSTQAGPLLVDVDFLYGRSQDLQSLDVTDHEYESISMSYSEDTPLASGTEEHNKPYLSSSSDLSNSNGLSFHSFYPSSRQDSEETCSCDLPRIKISPGGPCERQVERRVGRHFGGAYDEIHAAAHDALPRSGRSMADSAHAFFINGLVPSLEETVDRSIHSRTDFANRLAKNTSLNDILLPPVKT